MVARVGMLFNILLAPPFSFWHSPKSTLAVSSSVPRLKLECTISGRKMIDSKAVLGVFPTGFHTPQKPATPNSIFARHINRPIQQL